MSVRQKLEFLAGEAIDIAWLMRFNQALAGMDAESFVQSVLVNTLAAKNIVPYSGQNFFHTQFDKSFLSTLKISPINVTTD